MNWKIAIIGMKIGYLFGKVESCMDMRIPISKEEREECELPMDKDEIAHRLMFFKDEIENQCEYLIRLAIEV